MKLYSISLFFLVGTAVGQTLDTNTVYNLTSGNGNARVAASADGQVVSGVSTTVTQPEVQSATTGVAASGTVATSSSTPYKQPYVSGQSEEVKALMSNASKSAKAVTDPVDQAIAQADKNAELVYSASSAVAKHAASIAPQLDANGKSAKQNLAEIDSAKQQLASTTGDDDDSKNRREALQAKISQLEQQQEEGQKSTQALIKKNGAEAEAAAKAILDDPVNGYK